LKIGVRDRGGNMSSFFKGNEPPRTKGPFYCKLSCFAFSKAWREAIVRFNEEKEAAEIRCRHVTKTQAEADELWEHVQKYQARRGSGFKEAFSEVANTHYILNRYPTKNEWEIIKHFGLPWAMDHGLITRAD